MPSSDGFERNLEGIGEAGLSGCCGFPFVVMLVVPLLWPLVYDWVSTDGMLNSSVIL